MTRLPSLASKLLLAAVFVLVLAGTASGTASSAKLSARLTKTSFTSAQTSSVKLVCKFKATSKSFAYAITIKSGKKWKTVKSVRKTGSFKGSYTKTVKKLFAGKAVKLGSYTLKLSVDSGSKTLRFTVKKASSSGGGGGGGTTPTGTAPANTALPTISGTVKDGQTLTAHAGTWTGSPTAYAYRWDRCTASGASCADIGGATSGTYALVVADVGSTIRVIVTASNSHGSTSATSVQTAAVAGLPPANTSLPTISGTAKQGQTLSAVHGSWSGSPSGYAYQWRRCNSSGASCSDIGGATSSTYSLVVADADSTIRVAITATNNWGSTSTTSSQTASISGLVTGVSASWSHSCALLSDGKVECWGTNDYGQLGNGTITDSGSPVVVSGIANATQVVTGSDHSCALLSDTTVKCWGSNWSGELGNGTTTSSAPYGITTPVQVVGSGGTGTLTGVTQLSAGLGHTCAVRSDNTVWCWGDDNYGELGDGASGPGSASGHSATPLQVVNVGGSSTLAGVTEVSAGPNYSCARLSGGGVDCWGDGNEGELGNGSSGSGYESPSPVTVSTITSASEVNAQGYHACAVVSGAVWCWGSGGDGGLGNSSTNDSDVPVQVLAPDGMSPLTNAAHVAVGAYFSCALLSGGGVDCWGDGYDGELGNGAWGGGAWSDISVAVTGIATATQLSAGDEHACVLLPDHSIDCWGDNSYGQLGNGKFGLSKVPVAVSGAAATAQVSAGNDHTCAVHSDGTLWCWGHNNNGQLGNGSTTDSPVPVQVKGSSGGSSTLTNVTQVSAGGDDTCAVLTDYTAWCWGYNSYGQLGNKDGTHTSTSLPVQVTGVGGTGTLPGVTEVSAGAEHTCAVAGGHVDCWGRNYNGQLGNNSTTNSDYPVQAGSITTATRVSAGQYETCAADGSAAWCWGANYNGELGTGGGTPTVPVQVKGAGGTDVLANVDDITAGDEHTCAHLTDNSVWCWGWNSYGQLGIGSFDSTSYPTRVLGTGGGSSTLASTPSLSAGTEYSCAIRSSDNAVVCWGSDYYGRLGDNGIALAPVPAPVLGLP